MRLMSKGEYVIVPKGTKFTGAGKLGLKWNLLMAQTYTTRFLLTGYVGFTWRGTAEATASWSTVEGTLRVRSSYCVHGTPVTVAAAYPQSMLNGTPTTCSRLSGTASYETYVASQINLDVYL